MRSTSLSPSSRIGGRAAVSALMLALLASAALPAGAQGLRLPGQGGGPSLGGMPSTVDPLQAPPTSSPRPSAPLTAPAPAISAPPSAGSSASGRVSFGDEIIAVVNSEAITRLELERHVQAARVMLSRQNIAQPPEDVLARQVLERMIVERTQLQEAADMGIRIDDAQLDRAIGRIAEQNKVTVSQMRQQIERDGVPFAEYREDLRRNILMVRARERAVDSQVIVSEGEVDSALQDQGGGAQAGQVAQLTLAQILVRVPEGSSPDQIAALRAKAEELRRQAGGATDFGPLAASASDGEEALRGGDLGSRPADRWPQLFVDAVAPLNPGQVSDVVQSGNGFHILKLVERKRGTGATDLAPMPVQQTHARHILIRTSEVVSAEQAEQRLQDIRNRIVNGVSFADMARQYSNDGSAPQGGDLGWVSPGDTVPEFERAMDALAPGAISQPVQSPFGWHLITVEGRRTHDVSSERQRVVTRQALRERKLDQAYEDWARMLRDRAYVEIRLDPPAGG